MKKVVLFKKKYYTHSYYMRNYTRALFVGSLSIFLAAGIVVATTLGVVHHNNTSGQGGGNDQELTILMENNNEVKDDKAIGLESLIEPVTSSPEDKADKPLSYISYRVKKGDMIGYIASSYGVTTDTIYSANNSITNSRLIQPGQYIKIPSISGILYTVKKDNETPASIAEKYTVDAQRCASVNNLEIDSILKAGSTIFVPDALMDWETKLEINGDLFKLPLKNYFYISSRWGWRSDPFGSGRRTYHGGIDMACPKGTPIFASKPGKVEKTGYSNVYGNFVIINHGQGYKTLYGHMSKILTSSGAVVDNLTKIGLVGSTGQSTGPHLHFTVYKNGKSINPTNVVNFAKR